MVFFGYVWYTLKVWRDIFYGVYNGDNYGKTHGKNRVCIVDDLDN